jgi:hypothetical protein
VATDLRADVGKFSRRVLRRALWPHQIKAAKSRAFITVVAAARRTGKNVRRVMEPLVVAAGIVAAIAVVCAIVAFITWSRDRLEDDAGPDDSIRTNYGREMRRR